MENEKHEFALYCAALTDLLKQSPLKKGAGERAFLRLSDLDLLHRLRNVLRLEIGARIILFDEAVAATVELVEVAKKELLLEVFGVVEQKPLKPAVHWLVPLLEREALESVLVALTVMGATTITFIETDKSRSRKPLSPDRTKRLMISAAEQSKQFVLPVVTAVVKPFGSVIATALEKAPLLFFDPQGEASLTVVNTLAQKELVELTCLIGPEGDLTEQEKLLLKEKKAFFCALTPSILRAEVAVIVAMGMLRSCIRQDV